MIHGSGFYLGASSALAAAATAAAAMF